MNAPKSVCFFHPDRPPVGFDSKLKSAVEKHNAFHYYNISLFLNVFTMATPIAINKSPNKDCHCKDCP